MVTDYWLALKFSLYVNTAPRERNEVMKYIHKSGQQWW